jgi:hypothetical protein
MFDINPDFRPPVPVKNSDQKQEYGKICRHPPPKIKPAKALCHKQRRKKHTCDQRYRPSRSHFRFKSA